MKIIGIEEEKRKKKINSKKVFIAGIIGLMLIIFIILFIIYSASQSFRNLLDKYVFMKNVVEDSTSVINLNEDESENVYAYDKYICVLSENTLINYNSSGKEEGKVNIEITTPEVATNGRYILIGDKDTTKDKNNIYLISGNEIIWKKEIEGFIDRLCVNKNGYAAVALSGTSYKSVIQIFDNSGDELFKTYLSSTIAMDMDISNDNQHLSFLEVNTNGTSVQSNIKTISIQKAKQKAKDTSVDPIEYTYTEDNGKLIINIKYQDNNKLLCMYEDSIHTIKNKENKEIMVLSENGSKCEFADIELSDSCYRIYEKSTLINTQTIVEIMNTSTEHISTYSFDGVAKEASSKQGIIAINIGAEVHFISTNGWLVKKYISSQEVKKVVMCSNFAGIVYRNKIEIVNI